MRHNKRRIDSPAIRANELADFFGSAQLADEIVKDGWIKPVVGRHSCVIYDRADCLKAWNHLKKGEEPKRISRCRKKPLWETEAQ